MESPATLSELDSVFGNVLNLALGLAAIVLFIMIVINGFSYLTAGQDSRKLEAAKKSLTTAVIGFVLVALAFLILVLIGNFALTDTTNFLNFRVSQSNKVPLNVSPKTP